MEADCTTSTILTMDELEKLLTQKGIVGILRDADGNIKVNKYNKTGNGFQLTSKLFLTKKPEQDDKIVGKITGSWGELYDLDPLAAIDEYKVRYDNIERAHLGD